MGAPGRGLESHTRKHGKTRRYDVGKKEQGRERGTRIDRRNDLRRQHTGVDLAAQTKNGFAYAGTDNGAILCFIIDDLVLTVLNVLARGLAPWGW